MDSGSTCEKELSIAAKHKVEQIKSWKPIMLVEKFFYFSFSLLFFYSDADKFLK